MRLLGLLVAVIVGLIVTGFAIDLGPYIRGIAEKQGSNYLKRPMHIGRLSAKLTPGVFVVEDLVIEGLEPQSRPFLRAKKITVDFPWWTVFTRKLIIESVTMTDWEMVLETFPSSPEYPNGRHNLPKLTPERRDPTQPRRVNLTTTLKAVLADRGKLTFEDHGAPWSTVAPNLTVQLYRSDLTNDYRGRAAFSDGTINILTYEPFGANMRSRFNMQGGRVRFDRIDLLTDGARSIVTGDIDLGRWPEQLYQITSVIDFPTQKNIFFHNQNFTVSGTADFTGTFRLFKGGRDLRGTFHSKLAGVNAWRFRDLDGSVLWVPDRLDVTRANTKLYGGTARFDYRMAPLNRRDVPARATWNIEHRNVNLAMLTDFFETEGLRLSGSASGSHHIEWPIGKWALKEVHGEVAVDPPAGVQPMTREFALRTTEGRHLSACRGGALQSARRHRIRASCRQDCLLDGSRMDRPRQELGGDAEDVRRVRGTDGLRTALADSVPRHEPGLAGKRSSARRHHDRIRRADQGRAGGRAGRVRWRPARVVHAAAHSGTILG